MNNTYKMLSDGVYGAWIDTGYGKTAVSKPKSGDKVIITTKGGDKHERIVKSILKNFASGVIVSLMADEAVAKAAQQKYVTIVGQATSLADQKAKERLYDKVLNEGCEGFNPYRSASIAQNIECRD